MSCLWKLWLNSSLKWSEPNEVCSSPTYCIFPYCICAEPLQHLLTTLTTSSTARMIFVNFQSSHVTLNNFIWPVSPGVIWPHLLSDLPHHHSLPNPVQWFLFYFSELPFLLQCRSSRFDVPSAQNALSFRSEFDCLNLLPSLSFFKHYLSERPLTWLTSLSMAKL